MSDLRAHQPPAVGVQAQGEEVRALLQGGTLEKMCWLLHGKPGEQADKDKANEEKPAEAGAGEKLDKVWICGECGRLHNNWPKKCCKWCKAPRSRHEPVQAQTNAEDTPLLKLSAEAAEVEKRIGAVDDLDWQLGLEEIDTEEDIKRRAFIEDTKAVISALLKAKAPEDQIAA